MDEELEAEVERLADRPDRQRHQSDFGERLAIGLVGRHPRFPRRLAQTEATGNVLHGAQPGCGQWMAQRSSARIGLQAFLGRIFHHGLARPGAHRAAEGRDPGVPHRLAARLEQQRRLGLARRHIDRTEHGAVHAAEGLEMGAGYYEDCRRILAQIEEAEAATAGPYTSPTGMLTVTSPVLFGQMYVQPLFDRIPRRQSSGVRPRTVRRSPRQHRSRKASMSQSASAISPFIAQRDPRRVRSTRDLRRAFLLRGVWRTSDTGRSDLASNRRLDHGLDLPRMDVRRARWARS
jgi:hypothetical protein